MSLPHAALHGPAEQARLVPNFDAIFAGYSRFAWRAFARLGVQSRDLPDVCQEMFLVVHRKLPEFDPGRGSLRAWVYGICVRVASDYRRRHPNRREAPLDQQPSLAVQPGQDAALQDRRAWSKLARVLGELDAPKREVFVLYELEALPMAEVAAVLACPLQTAYARLHAARRAVLAAFAPGEPT